MKIDLGHDEWRLIIDGDGVQDEHEQVTLSVAPVEDESSYQSFWGSKPNLHPALTAKELNDGHFVGRIVLSELKLTEKGFAAQGLSLEETGTFYRNGIFLIQLWVAERLNDK